MVGARSPVDHDGSIDDTEEWTHVTTKSRRRSKRSTSHQYEKDTQVSKGLKPRIDNLRSVEEIRRDYFRIRSEWEGSEAGSKTLRDLVGHHVPIESPIIRAICLGIGTFDPLDGGWESKRRTFVQLIAFLSMVDEIENISGTRIECIFQEPLFSSHDKAFISSIGHRVVDSPAGFELVNQDALLFAVHLYRPIYAMALKKELPSVFVGTGWDVWESVTIGKTVDLDAMRIMEETYTKSRFPQDSTSTAFTSTCIYWKCKTMHEAADISTVALDMSRSTDQETHIDEQGITPKLQTISPS